MAWKFPRLPSPLASKKILLIESFEAIRDLQAALLQNHGIEVHVAKDIAEARSRCVGHSHDLVVVEMLDADTSTEEFCAELKRENPQQRVALLAASPAFPFHSVADEIISRQDGPSICAHRLKRILAGSSP
jgi:DNA-binding NtrC family response regulator